MEKNQYLWDKYNLSLEQTGKTVEMMRYLGYNGSQIAEHIRITTNAHNIVAEYYEDFPWAYGEVNYIEALRRANPGLLRIMIEFSHGYNKRLSAITVLQRG